MSKLTIDIRKDYTRLDRIEGRLQQRLEESTREAAQTIIEDIRSSWSWYSPSEPGQPPAMDTGNLNSSIKMERTGRTLSGRFAKTSDAVRWFIHIDTEKGIYPLNRGQYGGYVEFGTSVMAPRPYVRPALERLVQVFPNFFTRIVA